MNVRPATVAGVVRLGRRAGLDAALVLAVLIAGGTIGASYHQAFRAAGEREDFGQYTFAAAVSLACGHGFWDIAADAAGQALPVELQQFLALERDSVDCAVLPSDLPGVTPNLTQGLYRYLMTAVAAVWVVTGVSWSALSPLFGAFYGLTLAAAYGLFRLGMGRVLALAATAALAVSAVHLGHLPYLRDYAKAPFMLALLLIMAHLARGPFEPRRALWLSGAFGVVLGIGFGFRNDLLITTLPWLAVVLLCTPVAIRARLSLKAACLAVSAATFLVSAAPVLVAYGRGSNTGHVALLGAMTPFDAPLGVTGSVYEWGYVYSDHLAGAMVVSYALRAHAAAIEYLTPAYDAAAVRYLLDIAWQWPADLALRAYASVLKVLDLPFAWRELVGPVPRGLTGTWAESFYAAQAGRLGVLLGAGPYLLAAALAVMASTGLRAPLTLVAFAAYFAGYPAIQFHVRHYFHLEFITWWSLGFLAQHLVGVLRRRAGWSRWRSSLIDAAPRAGAVLAVTALLAVTPVAALRAWQDGRLSDAFAEEYLAAAREDLPVVADPLDDGGRTLLALPTLWDGVPGGTEVRAAYLAVEFSSASCPVPDVSVAFRFRDPAATEDYRKVMDARLAPGGAPTTVFFPVYDAPALAAFRGVDVRTSERGCLSRISRVAEADLPRLLLVLNLTPAWREATLHQTLSRYESATDGLGPRVTYVSWPDGVPRPPAGRAASIAGDSAVVLSEPALVARGGEGWRVQGRPSTPYAYLLGLRPAPVPAGGHFVVTGELRRGGLTVGLLKDDRWAGTVNVTTPGPFVAVVEVADAGDYAPIVANYGAPGFADAYLAGLRPWLPSFLTRASRVDFDIHSAGWIHEPGH